MKAQSRMKTARLLYLGHAGPPRVQRQQPQFSHGSRFQAQMMAEVRRHFDVRCVSALPFAVDPAAAVAGQEPEEAAPRRAEDRMKPHADWWRPRKERT
jgi:hypothetical protein